MPDEFLLCNGASVSKADYPNLAAALGETGTTFSLPDYRDRVPQGAGTVSPNVSISAGVPDIQGSIYPSEEASEEMGVQFLMDANPNYDGAVYVNARRTAYNMEQTVGYNDYYPADISLMASKYSSVYGSSSTVQPAAIAANFLIKT